MKLAKKYVTFVGVFLLGFLALGWGISRAQSRVVLVASGSSLPEPLYLKWNDAFHRENDAITIRYLPLGTSNGADNTLAGSGDFGGGDAPIPEKELSAAKTPILELPTVLIGIAIVYNVPGPAENLRLSGPVLADIFLGKTRFWNDPEIAKLNPGASLPPLAIHVVHRTDGKGSNYIFSEYLAKVSAGFLAKAGHGTSPKWPVGQAFNRTEDLLAEVKNTKGAIGYTELNWGLSSGLRMATLRNAAGDFVRPTDRSIAAAASALESRMTRNFRVSLVNAPGPESYPIASFTWLYVPERHQEPERGRAVNKYLAWVYSAGQTIAKDDGYATLPPSILEKVKSAAAKVN
jgi:phosphate transport system substrate-binding protein